MTRRLQCPFAVSWPGQLSKLHLQILMVNVLEGKRDRYPLVYQLVHGAHCSYLSHLRTVIVGVNPNIHCSVKQVAGAFPSDPVGGTAVHRFLGLVHWDLVHLAHVTLDIITFHIVPQTTRNEFTL